MPFHPFYIAQRSTHDAPRSLFFMALQVADGDDKYAGKSRVVQLLDNFKIHGPNGTRILWDEDIVILQC